MLANYLVIPVALILTLRCSHTAKSPSMPPPYQSGVYSQIDSKDPQSIEIHFQKYKSKDSPLQTQLWARYKLGQAWQKKDPQKACEYFRALSEEPQFPLSDLAYLHSIETCEGKSIQSQRLFRMRDDISKLWLRPQIYRLQYQFAKMQDLYPEKAEAALALSKESLIPGEKIAYVEEALAWAKTAADSDRIQLLQQRLEKLSPSRIAKPLPEQMFDVAYDLRRQRKFSQAISVYKKIANHKKSSVSDKMKAWRGIARSHKLAHDKGSYLKALFSLASVADKNLRRSPRQPEAQRLHHEAQIELARALWTEGQVKKAQTILQKLAKTLQGKYPTDQIHWLLARMAEERADFLAATEHAKKSMTEARTVASSYEEKSAWILAWNLKKMGQAEAAAQIFAERIPLLDNPYERAKYQFWYAHSLEQSQKKLDAYQAYLELSQQDPLGYYGLLAYRQRGEKIPALQSTIKEAEEQSLDLETSDLSIIEWLIAVNETELAQAYLKTLNPRIESEEERRSLYRLYSRASYFAGIFRDLAQMDNETKNQLVLANPEYLFPRPYLALTNELSNRYQVDPALVYSIIRQESSFIPHARSFADAFGLMQLIPKQAARLAKLHGVGYQQPEDLYDPQINLPLGIAFLRELWDRKQGQFMVTVASYNASEKAVNGWIQSRYRGDPIVFIEDIPYEETKGYIKLVLRNFIWYQRLAARHQDLEFPDWTLAGLEKFVAEKRKLSAKNQ